MDDELASAVLNACYRSANELANLAPIMKERCSDEEHAVLRREIGRVIHDILENVLGYVATQNPKADAIVQARLRRGSDT
jgi:hypothetical protein